RRCIARCARSPRRSRPTRSTRTTSRWVQTRGRGSASGSSRASRLQATNAFLSAGAASPDEFYDTYTMDLEPEGQWARARRRFMHHRLAVASLAILTIVSAAGFLSSHIAPYGYDEIKINALNAAPSWAHPFGTSQIGRDYFSRTLYGIRT